MRQKWKRHGALALLLGVVVSVGALLLWRWWAVDDETDSNTLIVRYLTQPMTRAEVSNGLGERCEGAPFILPSSGLIGLLYADPARPYNATRRHTGIDIFGDGEVGTVPIVAAYDGYLTRLPEWRSTVIMRHDDPLQAGRTIWTYYTHMATRDGSRSTIAPDFPPDTREVFVRQGTLLGYQGDYAGSGAPIAMHLHFSIVLSDGGTFLNEAVLGNTLDPSPYFSLPLTVAKGLPRPLRCS